MHAFVLQESPSAGFDTLFEPLSPEEDDFFDMPDDGANDEVLHENLVIDLKFIYLFIYLFGAIPLLIVSSDVLPIIFCIFLIFFVDD